MPIKKEREENFEHKILRTICISLGIWIISVSNAIYINKNINLEYLMMTLVGMGCIGLGLYTK